MGHDTWFRRALPIGFAGVIFTLLVAGTRGQAPGGAVKVTITDGKPVAGDWARPIDPTPRAFAQHGGDFAFGIKVDGHLITCTEGSSAWCHLRVDGQEIPFAFGFQGKNSATPRPLPPTARGKKRSGFIATHVDNNVRFTQSVELVPSRSANRADAGRARRMDTYRVTYVVENIAKDGGKHQVELKASIDTLIGANDGALFAAPTTHPGKILNGITLRGKSIPEYVQVLERPNLTDPGFMGVLTLRHNKGENPDVFVMTTTAVIFAGWEPPAQAAGDSACCLLWNARTLRGGEKRTMVYAYGGGIATDADEGGPVSLTLGGSFAPHKLFTISAVVDDPALNQALTLELPEGMERVEGRAIQPVPPPGPSGSSMVLWKARVLRTGDFDVRVRSSDGTTQVKHVRIEPADRQ